MKPASHNCETCKYACEPDGHGSACHCSYLDTEILDVIPSCPFYRREKKPRLTHDEAVAQLDNERDWLIEAWTKLNMPQSEIDEMREKHELAMEALDK